MKHVSSIERVNIWIDLTQPTYDWHLFHHFSDDSMVHLAGIFHNMYLKVQESEVEHYKDDDGWKFHIHDANEVPILAVTTHGTSLYPGQGRDLRLDMQKVIRTS